jgi:hypothetical protein
MQAIVTKYHPSTSAMPNRWSATASAGRVYVSDGEAGDWSVGHKTAAAKLIAKFGWGDTEYVGGGLQDGRMVWVPVCEHNRDVIPATVVPVE